MAARRSRSDCARSHHDRLQEGRSAPNEWAPVHLRHRGARHLRYRRRISGRDQLDFRIDKRLAFAFRSRGYVWIFRRRKRVSSCCLPNLRRDLAVEQGHWLEPVASCSSPRVGRRTSVRIRCLLFDHMIGRHSRDAGSSTLRYPDRCSVSNAAADIVGCQVTLCEIGAWVPALVPPTMDDDCRQERVEFGLKASSRIRFTVPNA